MKKYEMPEIEVKVFALEDVIATSAETGCLADCPNDNCPSALDWG